MVYVHNQQNKNPKYKKLYFLSKLLIKCEGRDALRTLREGRKRGGKFKEEREATEGLLLYQIMIQFDQ